VAKSMSVSDGDGTITNSAGAVGEEAIFWKPAEWCDYSGAVSPGVVNGIALFSHPANGNHPPDWHVRSDGWMGACLSRESECVVAVDAPLLLRYGLYVHRGGVDEAGVASRFEAFATSALAPCQA
ncbi:MAG TPA: PmoA family protein, partial [Armatimonadota bacterium]|nr:PmoA family protein [Armatimonadota bacterium]